MKNINRTHLTFFLFATLSLASCLTPAKMDKFVSTQYNDQLPKRDKKMKADISINTATPEKGTDVSMTQKKTNSFLPLIVYWKYDHQFTCSLNKSIAITQFTNTVNDASTKSLTSKLNGRKLELTIEKIPSEFALRSNEQVIWLIYAISWQKVYIQPDSADLVVSYKLQQQDNFIKTGTITINNTSSNKGLRFFQSWKSATSEHITDYTANLIQMTKSFMNKLSDEL